MNTPQLSISPTIATTGERSTLSMQCGAAAKISMPDPEVDDANGQEQGDSSEAGVFVTVCCHLQKAAVTYAGDNLRFFGRQGRGRS